MPARKRHARPPRRTPWFAPLEACHARTGFEERAQICQRSCCVPTMLPRRTDTTADPQLLTEARDWFRTPGALETKAVGR